MATDKSAVWDGLHAAANVGRSMVVGIVLIVVVFGGFGLWATVAPLSGALVASGVVKVDSNRKTIQHFEGGIVSEIRVRDGDHVAAGQVLVVLVDERVGANFDSVTSQLVAAGAREARLQAERDGLDEIPFPESLIASDVDPRTRELVRSEQLFFAMRRAGILEQKALIEAEIGQAAQQVAALRQQVVATDAAAAYLAQEIAANEAMEKKQYVQKIHILGLQRAMEQYNVGRGEYLADIALAQQKSTELQLKMVGMETAFAQEASDDLIASRARINDLQEQLRPLRDRNLRQQVVSPIGGTVVDLRVHTAGGVINPGEPMMDIVPDDNPLIIEARISVTDIDDISPGQEADIRLSAYKMRSTPLISGRVVYVAADRMVDDATQEPYYQSRIEVDMDSMREAENLKLYPGMPAEVFIKTGTRTALDYLLAPITQTLRRSLRES